MSTRRRDPWDLVAIPIYWGYIGVLMARDYVVRLNSQRRCPKPSPGTGTVRTVEHGRAGEGLPEAQA